MAGYTHTLSIAYTVLIWVMDYIGGEERKRETEREGERESGDNDTIPYDTIRYE